MKLTFTVDPHFISLLNTDEGRDHWDTHSLISEADSRGHDVAVVDSTDTSEGRFSKEISFNIGRLIERPFGIPDALMIRGYGMLDGRNYFDSLVESVRGLEGEIPVVLNSSHATEYSRKDRQKGLDLPFIPSYRISGEGDVRRLISDHNEGIILKPLCGLQGNGVEYVRTQGDFDKLVEGGLDLGSLVDNYLVEEFVSDPREVRHVFLYGDHVGSRVALKTGEPAREILGHRYLETNPDPAQLKIARDAIEITGINYGCVDFRGGYVLEINGSGAQTFYRPKVGGGKVFLDLAPRIIDGIEKKVSEAS
jgi:hypothetical protein